MHIRTKPRTSEYSTTVDDAGSPTRTRLWVLDGLRGTVLFVPLVHFRSFFVAETIPESLYLHIGDLGGVVAVDVFFVLSGFLITGILLDTKSSPSYFRQFYARRVLRIVPVYYGFLLTYFTLLPRWLGSARETLEITPVDQLSYWLYLLNVRISVAAWMEPGHSEWYPAATATAHLWSLSVEEQFYLLWPAVVLVCSRTTFKWVCVGCVVAVPALRLAITLWRPASGATSWCTSSHRSGSTDSPLDHSWRFRLVPRRVLTGCARGSSQWRRLEQ